MRQVAVYSGGAFGETLPMTSPFHYPPGRVERLRRKFRLQAHRYLGRMPFIVEAQGARFLIDPMDTIDHAIALEGIWEGPQLDHLARVSRLRRTDYFLDIGANSGFYSIMFATKNLADTIIAFEPDPGNFGHLAANLFLNGLSNRIKALPVALGDREGDVLLYEGAKWNRGESTIAEPDQTPKEITHVVRQTRFDQEFDLKGKAIVLKIDVEGYEFHTLSGLEQTLRNNLCYAQVELYSDRLEELKQRFQALGFRYLHTEYIDHYFTNMPEIV